MASKNVIDLRIISEGMFGNFVSAVVGFILGKRSLNTVIKGQKDQIETLKKYLEKSRKSEAERERIIQKFESLRGSSKSVEQLKKDFYKNTGIKLP